DALPIWGASSGWRSKPGIRRPSSLERGEEPVAANFLMIRPDLEGLPPIEVPEGYALRTYRKGDEAAWCAMMEGQIGEGWTLEKWRQEMEEKPQFDPDGLFFIVAGDEPVATACAWCLPDKYGPQTGILHMVAARPDHQGKGMRQRGAR